MRVALERLRPDCVLVEGPPDAEGVLSLLGHKSMKPPVAMLIYVPDQPKWAVYYPFAVFSPEWQAIDYAVKNKVLVRFMDLPQTHQLAEEIERWTKFEEELKKAIEAKAGEQLEGETSTSATLPADAPAGIEGLLPTDGEGDEAPAQPQPDLWRRDPLRFLAEAAGYTDGERWWEHLVEERREGDQVFEAVLEAMTALRDAAAEAKKSGQLKTPEFEEQREARREAWMRQTIRSAQKEGFKKIAVVCGAWHAPSLANLDPSAKDDAAILKSLPKVKVTTTWVPWTYSRLMHESGYGAGISSPGWYLHLWETYARAQGSGFRVQEKDNRPSPQPSPGVPGEGEEGQDLAREVGVRWMTRVGRLLRGEDLEASSASVIEAVRLAETLAAMRSRPLPGLGEMNEASQTVFCFGSDLPMRLIHQKLIVGEKLGEVPDDAPMVPLAADLSREQKRLRLPPDPAQKTIDLDLRKENDLAKSRLLHRLNLLNVPWGQVLASGSGKGTFHELWRTQWQPEFAVAVIEAAIWGNTVIDAATAYANDLAGKATALPQLTELVDEVLLSDLPAAVEPVMKRVEEEAALASDVTHLMAALPPLANVMRYGNVRKTDTAMVARVVDAMVARICINLPLACASLNDDAAQAMFDQINSVHAAIALLQKDEHVTMWQGTLKQLADMQSVHGLVAGRCVRILLDASAIQRDQAETRMSLALSAAAEPSQAAAWVEGFLRGSGLLLLHDESLWQVLDEWVTQLNGDVFVQLLPLLRRTFSTFPAPERRQMGERVKRGMTPAGKGRAIGVDEGLDVSRAESVLPVVRMLLGVKP